MDVRKGAKMIEKAAGKGIDLTDAQASKLTHADRQLIAQYNATIDLGLPPGNTAAERAEALGHGGEQYHATTRDFAGFVPSSWRGASYTADTPHGAVKGAVAGAQDNGHGALPHGSTELSGFQVMPLTIRGKVFGRNPFPEEWLPPKELKRSEFDKIRADWKNWKPDNIDGLTDEELRVLRHYRVNALDSYDTHPDFLMKLLNASPSELDAMRNIDEPIVRGSTVASPIGWESLEGPSNEARRSALQKAGFPSTLVEDEAGISTATFDPANIRSRFAAFDPRRLKSKDLLAGGAGLAAIAAATAPGEAEASFPGPLSKTADLAALDTAKKLAASGADRQHIWDNTGWFQGPDQKWRYELSDHTAMYRGTKAAGTNYLDHVMPHEELYKAYPFLRNVRVYEGGPGMQEGGTWDSILQRINAYGPNKGSTVPHEWQHAIQDHEGFARGGSPDYFNQQQEAILARDALSWRNELLRQKEKMPQADTMALENAVVHNYQKAGIMDWLPSREARDIARQPDMLRPDLYPDSTALNDVRNIVSMYGLDKNTTPYSADQMYRMLGGEAESRLVQSRLGMTPEERAANPPWLNYDVPEAKQKILMDHTPGEVNTPASRSAPGFSLGTLPETLQGIGKTIGQAPTIGHELMKYAYGQPLAFSKDVAKMAADPMNLVNNPYAIGTSIAMSPSEMGNGSMYPPGYEKFDLPQELPAGHILPHHATQSVVDPALLDPNAFRQSLYPTDASAYGVNLPEVNLPERVTPDGVSFVDAAPAFDASKMTPEIAAIMERMGVKGYAEGGEITRTIENGGLMKDPNPWNGAATVGFDYIDNPNWSAPSDPAPPTDNQATAAPHVGFHDGLFYTGDSTPAPSGPFVDTTVGQPFHGGMFAQDGASAPQAFVDTTADQPFHGGIFSGTAPAQTQQVDASPYWANPIAAINTYYPTAAFDATSPAGYFLSNHQFQTGAKAPGGYSTWSPPAPPPPPDYGYSGPA